LVTTLQAPILVPRNQSFARVLVVGVSPESNQRCEFEHTLVARIKSA